MEGHYYSFRAKPGSVPRGAVLISQDEALVLQRRFLSEWKNKFQVLPLNYSPLFTSGTAAISAAMISNHFRRKLKLRNFGRFTIQVPTVFMPGIFAGFFHQLFVTDAILLQQECDVCVQVRSICLQVGFGFLIPSLLSPLASFTYASRYGTYPVPPISAKNWKLFLEIYTKITKRFSSKSGLLVIANFFVGHAMCFWQQNNFLDIHRTVAEEYEGMGEAMDKFADKAAPLKVISRWI